MDDVLTWFSHGSGATLAPEPLVRVPFSTTRVFETLFFFELKERDVVEILAGHRVGQEDQCGTILEDSCQELASVVVLVSFSCFRGLGEENGCFWLYCT